MYIPKIYAEQDIGWIKSFIAAHSFGIIVSVADNKPVATHLPFVISGHAGNLRLTSHFAKANAQWKSMRECNVLVVFNGPHAYISPANYLSVENVPTWNYLAAHVYGTVKLLTEWEEIAHSLATSINAFQPGYLDQWKGLPDTYKRKMMNAIVAFEVAVTEVQAVKKLSQNKKVQEQQNIIAYLQTGDDSSARELASYMEIELKKGRFTAL